jgi:hypothetical protein
MRNDPGPSRVVCKEEEKMLVRKALITDMIACSCKYPMNYFHRSD